MTQNFLGEIRMFGGNFAPFQWAFCNGQLLAISQNDALFSLIGTTFGGDGKTTFALPDLRGRLSVGMGQGPGLSDYRLGQKAGSEEVTLLTTTIPSHNHMFTATTTSADQTSPAGHLAGTAPVGNMYEGGSPTLAPLSTVACGNTGGSRAHENLMPALCVTFIIALTGIYPSRS